MNAADFHAPSAGELIRWIRGDTTFAACSAHRSIHENAAATLSPTAIRTLPYHRFDSDVAGALLPD
jgi:hypothetical protein